jgi:helicase
VEELQIDERLKAALIQEEIVDLYPPQAEAIQLGLLGGKNFVVAIPTASGKTLIAILAMITRLLQRGGKAVYLAPLKALASEKYMEIKELAETVGLRVSISTGDPDDRAPWLGSSDIIIATNEKFDSLIRHQVSWLNDIQVIVSDEVHLINDAHRGPVLEVVLSLVRQNLPDCQIVALSATIINADEIAEWIDAELVLSSWRPVQLREGVWHSGSLK